MTVSNKISIFRLLLIPVIVLLKVFPYAQFGVIIPYAKVGFVTLSYLNIVILILFAVASLSDFLDGYLARKYNQVTTFGKFIDPIADKALTTTMFVIFAVEGILPIVVVLLMIWRDVVVDGIRMMCAQHGTVVAAGPLGKAKTVVQMITIMLILLNNLPFALWYMPITDCLIWLCVFLSISSGISYFLQAKSVILQSK